VLPVEFEIRPVVIERSDLPQSCGMAAEAVGSSSCFKLFVMIVFMTVGTAGGQARKPLNHDSRRIPYKMTNPAAFGCMGAVKQETGAGMVKRNFAPGCGFMAGIAVLVRVILFLEERTVNVLVAVGTANSDVFETPFGLFPVTGKTGCGQVGILQPEAACVMLLDGI
jgi:hypothetical protein